MAEDGWPRTIDHEAGTLTLSEKPETVISTSPSLTGTLLALDVPLEATATAMIGGMTDDTGFFLQWAEPAHARGVDVLYTNLTFDFEAVLARDPDLVVGSSTGGDSIEPYVAELQAMGIPVLLLDYGDKNWLELAEVLGHATGHEADVDRITDTFAARTAEAKAAMTIPESTASVVSYNFVGTYSVAKPESAQARVLSDMGFTVAGIPDDMRGLVQRSREIDFISHENLPAAITGDTVFLMRATQEDVKAFMADPVLANVPAVKAGRVYSMGPTSFRVDYYSGLDIIDTVAPYFTE
tara:strand:- start:194 stop:1081 length:888 start_codon:yes stop_codon:yes gene_type:complete